MEVQHDNEDLGRLIVHGPEDVLVELALESAPTVDLIGPTSAG